MGRAPLGIAGQTGGGNLGVDTTTPTRELVANIMGTFAQFERRLIGQRTKDALAQKKARGAKLGRPRTLPEPVVRRLEGLRDEGLSYGAIAEVLNEAGVPTARAAKVWFPNTEAAACEQGVLITPRAEHLVVV